MANFTLDKPPERPLALLDYVQYLYALVLLLTFAGVAAVHSVITARSEEDLEVSDIRGPGGKPLPITRRKPGSRRSRRSASGGSGNEVDDQSSCGDAERPTFGLAARRVFQYITAFAAFTFVADGIAISVHSISDRVEAGTEEGWWCGEARVVYVLGAAFLYLYFLITLFDWEQSPNIVHFVAWCLASVGELVIFAGSVYRKWEDHGIVKGVRLAKHGRWYMAGSLDGWDVIDLTIGGVRLGLVVGLALLYAVLTLARRCGRYRGRSHHDDQEVEFGFHGGRERTPLLNGSYRGGYMTHGPRENGHHENGSANGAANGNANGTAGRRHGANGIANRPGPAAEDDECSAKIDHAGYVRPEKLPHKSWWEYLRGYSLFLPYLWPSKNVRLQVIVLICFVILLLQRGVNILVPRQIGIVTNKLTDYLDGTGAVPMPWTDLLLLMLYKLLQGPSGLLGSLRALLWIPVSQYSYRALTTSAFEHVHSLSLDFHLGKRTGEVLSALNKGASINNFLEQVTFQVFPMLIDLVLAIIYFQMTYDSIYATIVSIITLYYLILTIKMAATRADQRRDMVNADREEVAVKNDSITSYETVKYFNAEQYEFQRYRNAIKNFQKAEAQVTWGMNLMNIAQALVFMCGMLVAMMLGAWQVSQRIRSVGDFVTLITFLGQLQGPLNFFGTFYRTIQQAMISGERLLELFKIRPTVVDRPGVGTLPRCDGHIRWAKVHFSYDKQRTALRDLSFECTPGTTTAFVGESGGGKSTIFRLMFRYYNCQDGRILVDGKDVKDLTIDSVRRHIGVVPQDTILFNESIMYNLKYANQDATNDDVYEACRAASIHDRIMSFPDGYNTMVGERGLRLSGGEKQRVAIARTILKKPKVIMLDEATSALDTQTEQFIQEKLFSLGQGRTLLIIAHRLSTITHADQIIVLHQGTIVEKGTHDELLARGGRYATMWEKQSRAEEAAEQARRHQKRFQRLAKRADMPVSGISGANERDHNGYNSHQVGSHGHGHNNGHHNGAAAANNAGDAPSDGCNSMASSTFLVPTPSAATAAKGDGGVGAERNGHVNGNGNGVMAAANGHGNAPSIHTDEDRSSSCEHSSAVSSDDESSSAESTTGTVKEGGQQRAAV